MEAGSELLSSGNSFTTLFIVSIITFIAFPTVILGQDWSMVRWLDKGCLMLNWTSVCNLVASVASSQVLLCWIMRQCSLIAPPPASSCWAAELRLSSASFLFV